MSLATRAKPEKAPHSPITRLLEGQGLHVWDEARIRASERGTRTADHVAWRWDGDELEPLTVEVKPGRADVGLCADLDALLSFARALTAPRVGPHFEIQTTLRAHTLSLTEAEARRQAEDAPARLRTIQVLLNERL